MTDEPAVLSRAGGVRFSRRDTAATIDQIPSLQEEVRRRDGHVPVLRLPFEADVVPPEGFDTAVLLPLHDEAAADLVRRLLQEADDALLLALPTLDRIEIDVDGNHRTLAGAADRWQVQRAVRRIGVAGSLAMTASRNDASRTPAARPGLADPEADPLLGELLEPAPEWVSRCDPDVRRAVGLVREIGDLDWVRVVLDRLVDCGDRVRNLAVEVADQRLGRQRPPDVLLGGHTPILPPTGVPITLTSTHEPSSTASVRGEPEERIA